MIGYHNFTVCIVNYYTSNIISNVLDEGEIPIVVLSAMGDTTNKLLKASELSLKNNDIIESKRIIYGATTV